MAQPTDCTQATSAEIAEAALAAEDDDERARLIAVLHRRGSQGEVELARGLAASSDTSSQELGIDILGQLGFAEARSTGRWPYYTETLPLLRAALASASDPVVSSACYAFSHLGVADVRDDLLRLAKHTSSDVREAVAVALGTSHDRRATEALLSLMEDVDEDVRNWATFGVAQGEHTDSAVSAALLAKSLDPNDEVRLEALVGLARRGDSRCVEPIRRDLCGDVLSSLAIEAAGEIHDPSLREPLERWLERLGPDDEFAPLLQAALAAIACTLCRTIQAGEATTIQAGVARWSLRRCCRPRSPPSPARSAGRSRPRSAGRSRPGLSGEATALSGVATALVPRKRPGIPSGAAVGSRWCALGP